MALTRGCHVQTPKVEKYIQKANPLNPTPGAPDFELKFIAFFGGDLTIPLPRLDPTMSAKKHGAPAARLTGPDPWVSRASRKMRFARDTHGRAGTRRCT